ncbi:MAG: hypothetical protein WA082_01245 [Candidatus Moraniibacteriota bacterium]
MTKKHILLFSGVMTLAALLAVEEFGFCSFIGLDKCLIPLDDSKEILLYPFPLVLFFSLLTYKMKEEVFQAWWRFSRWFVLMIVMVTFFLSVAPGQSGFAAVAAQSFNFLILAILYIAFILISLIKIVRAYRRMK